MLILNIISKKKENPVMTQKVKKKKGIQPKKINIKKISVKIQLV